jgi:glycosyltransferase involved in cell wall biosynthesis
VSGLLVPPRDADALATALRTLLDDAGLRRRLASAARAAVAAEYDERMVLERSVRLYARAAEAGARRHDDRLGHAGSPERAAGVSEPA